MADTACTQSPLTLDIATATHLGHARSCNQDWSFTQPEYGLAIVADGVGGQGDGAWASREALRQVGDRLDRQASNDTIREATIFETLQAAHTGMRTQNRFAAGQASGTTIAGLWAPHGAAGTATAFNVGDSPVLHLLDGVLTKVSRDHSLHQMWLDGGKIGREPGKRTIVQAIGISEVLAPYITNFKVAPGSKVLICTDGLSGNLSTECMRRILLTTKSSALACEALLSEALRGPAPDNITVSVCCF